MIDESKCRYCRKIPTNFENKSKRRQACGHMHRLQQNARRLFKCRQGNYSDKAVFRMEQVLTQNTQALKKFVNGERNVRLHTSTPCPSYDKIAAHQAQQQQLTDELNASYALPAPKATTSVRRKKVKTLKLTMEILEQKVKELIVDELNATNELNAENPQNELIENLRRDLDELKSKWDDDYDAGEDWKKGKAE